MIQNLRPWAAGGGAFVTLVFHFVSAIGRVSSHKIATQRCWPGPISAVLRSAGEVMSPNSKLSVDFMLDVT